MPKKTQPARKRGKTKRQEPREPDGLSILAGLARSILIAPLLDPYNVKLDELIALRQPTTSADPLLKLQHLHTRALRDPQAVHPLDAHTAQTLAGEVGLPAPAWALDHLKALQESLVRDRRVNLNQRLGFMALGKGNTSEAERRVKENILDRSMLHIWGLTLLGVTLTRAIHMEAGRMQQLAGWNTTDYDLESDLGSRVKEPARRARQLLDKQLAFAKQLRQQYYDWRTDSEKDPNSESAQYFRHYLLASREQFLAQFPQD